MRLREMHKFDNEILESDMCTSLVCRIILCSYINRGKMHALRLEIETVQFFKQFLNNLFFKK